MLVKMCLPLRSLIVLLCGPFSILFMLRPLCGLYNACMGVYLLLWTIAAVCILCEGVCGVRPGQ